MTREPSSASEDPRRLLTATRELTHRVRHAQGAGWFALLVFGVATLVATPFFRYGPRFRHCTPPAQTTYACVVYPTLVLWYWPITLVLGYAVIAGFYLRRARTRGLGTRVQPYVVVGVLLGLLAAAWSVWAYTHPAFLAESLHLGQAQPATILFRLTSPAGVIGLALLVLAWIERSWLLGALTAVYLVAVGAGGTASHRLSPPSPWAFLPHLLLLAGILLVGSGILGLVQRRSQAHVA